MPTWIVAVVAVVLVLGLLALIIWNVIGLIKDLKQARKDKLNQGKDDEN